MTSVSLFWIANHTTRMEFVVFLYPSGRQTSNLSAPSVVSFLDTYFHVLHVYIVLGVC